MIHLYKGDVLDSSGNGNGGVIYGDPQYRRSCIDDGIAVNGSGDYVLVPYNPSLQPDDVTLEVFFRPRRVLRDNAGFIPIVVKMPSWGNFWNTVDGYDIWYQDSGGGGRVGFGIASPDGRLRYTANFPGEMTPSKYYHVVGTYDGTEIRLYVDGELVDVTPHTLPIGYLSGPIHVGGHISHSYYGVGRHYFDGVIDEVVVYDYALSPEEIHERSLRCPRAEVSDADEGLDAEDAVRR
jgi:hypothetical protein